MNTDTIQPLGNRVLLRRIQTRQTTSGGIIIPESAKEKPQIAIVAAVGPGKKFSGPQPMEDGGYAYVQGRMIPSVSVGDVILFGKYSGQDFTFQGEEYLFVQEEEILGVLEDYKGEQ